MAYKNREGVNKMKGRDHRESPIYDVTGPQRLLSNLQMSVVIEITAISNVNHYHFC